MTTAAGGIPLADEVEVTFFGPGYGECSLIHLGHGDCMIVDSCVSRDGSIPVLNHLDMIGVNTATAVKLVVATHWHDDHIRGISSVLQRCASARFACSAALRGDELLTGINARGSGMSLKTVSTGVREMSAVMRLLLEGRAAQWAIEGRLIYSRSGDMPVNVFSLSPSDKTLTSAYRQIGDLILGGSGRVGRPNRNLAAVVLWIDIAGVGVLLGSDLEETANPLTGWTAAISSAPMSVAPAEVFKVPCHGSPIGHQSRVWAELLCDEPEAVVSPYMRGSTGLPSPSDISRLCKLTSRVHLTAGLRPSTSIYRGRPLSPVSQPFGRVTLRRLMGGHSAWDADYDPPAGPACNGAASNLSTEVGRVIAETES